MTTAKAIPSVGHDNTIHQAATNVLMLTSANVYVYMYLHQQYACMIGFDNGELLIDSNIKWGERIE
jgi:hypothetical protein